MVRPQCPGTSPNINRVMFRINECFSRLLLSMRSSDLSAGGRLTLKLEDHLLLKQPNQEAPGHPQVTLSQHHQSSPPPTNQPNALLSHAAPPCLARLRPPSPPMPWPHITPSGISTASSQTSRPSRTSSSTGRAGSPWPCMTSQSIIVSIRSQKTEAIKCRYLVFSTPIKMT